MGKARRAVVVSEKLSSPVSMLGTLDETLVVRSVRIRTFNYNHFSICTYHVGKNIYFSQEEYYSLHDAHLYCFVQLDYI